MEPKERPIALQGIESMHRSDVGEIQAHSEAFKYPDEDNTFQPPALSSYAMSLLNDLNENLALGPVPSGHSMKDSNRRETIMRETSWKRDSIAEKTTTVETKRSSIAHHITTNTNTPYTAAMTRDFDFMGIDMKHQPQFDLESDPRFNTPKQTNGINQRPFGADLVRQPLEPLKSTRSLRRFAKINLGAPKRISVLEDSPIEISRPSEVVDSYSNMHKEDQENVVQVKHQYSPVPGRRRVLSSISPNIDAHRYNSKRNSVYEPPRSESSTLIKVNDRTYHEVELLGKGGSSKVYKLRLTTNNKAYAIKQVTFDDVDEMATRGFLGEIDLLKKLSSEQRVIKLYDYEIFHNSLSLVMECGDIDLAHVLSSRINLPLDVSFTRYHVCEMLKCVAAVHLAGIVHSDLKPANFIFVKGILKIIDFGIANTISDHTVNVYRESQIGTPNYMSPESLLEVNSPGLDTADKSSSTWKVGRPSDIWSCGCIFYQMIYGRPPYAKYSGNQRLLLIMNPQIKILYPEYGLGDVKVPKSAIEMIQGCLERDPLQRLTIDEILNGAFCKPRNVSKDFVRDLVTNAINFGIKNGDITKESLNVLTSEVWNKIEELNL